MRSFVQHAGNVRWKDAMAKAWMRHVQVMLMTLQLSRDPCQSKGEISLQALIFGVSLFQDKALLLLYVHLTR